MEKNFHLIFKLNFNFKIVILKFKKITFNIYDFL